MSLRDKTSENHARAEKHPFNQRLLQGKLTDTEYLIHLTQLYNIYETIEDTIVLPLTLLRSELAYKDIVELENKIPGYSMEFNILDSTYAYCFYLETLKKEDLYAHVYLNYMALLYGGEQIKKIVPGTGRVYQFEDGLYAISHIRAQQKDEWADEVNKGFEYVISIYDELHGLSR